MNKTIKRYRKQKGWSQEEFSEQANVSLRTIQRIENNESNPSGKTLLLLCNALEISIEDLNIDTQHENKSFLSLFHLSALSFLIIPFGNIIIPLAFWLSKRDKIKGLRATGARLLNFQMMSRPEIALHIKTLKNGKQPRTLYKAYSERLFNVFKTTNCSRD